MPIPAPNQAVENRSDQEEAERAYTAGDDDDLDEPLPARQESCSLDGECETCQ